MINLKKPSSFIFALVASLILYAVGFHTGAQSVHRPSQPYKVTNQYKGAPQTIDFSLFWATWKQLEESFVDPSKIVPKTMYYGAIKGMVASLGDPYTYFLTPDENKESKDDLGGKFEGIGAELGLKGGQIVIVAPIKNSPAERAGVKSGDFILKVDGKSTDGWTLYKAVDTIRGKHGTNVKLTLYRSSKEVDITIKRDVIKVDSTELTIEKGIAVLKLNKFGDNTDSEWDQKVQQIVAGYEKGTIKGMVLDVRNNPGGYLQGAVYVASEFLSEGKIVVSQDDNNGHKDNFTVTRNGRLLKIPLVVLINEGSASASEIVSGALKDHKRAQLIGMKSFGKGSVQIAEELPGGAGVHITIARWITPNGVWIHEKGIQPDIKVENKTDGKNTLTDDTDAQLQKAIEIVGQTK